MEAPELLTRAEVAEHLRTPVTTLAQWAHRRTGPPLYRRADVEAWLAEQEQERREAVGAS